MSRTVVEPTTSFDGQAALRPSRRQWLFLTGGVTATPAVFTLAACGAGSQQAPAAASKAPVTIRWSTWGGANHPMVQAASQGLALFKQQQPHVTVEAEPQETGFADRNLAQWLAGTGPDISGGSNEIPMNWSRRGLLLKLDPLVKRDFTAAQLQEYVDTQYKFFSTREHGQHALPMYLGTMAMAYNKDLFRRTGLAFPDDTWDWPKWVEGMRKLTDASQDQFGGQLNTNIPRLQERIIQNGGWVVDPNNDLTCLLDQPPAIEALQWVYDRTWRDNVSAQPAQKQGKNLVNLGKIGMWDLGSWQLAAIVKDVGTQFQWDVTVYTKGKQRDTVATTDGWTVWNGTKAQDACWLLMRFLQTDAWIEIFSRITATQPARRSMADRWIKIMKESVPGLADKNLAAYNDGISKGYARPNAVFRFDTEVRPQLQDAITKTMDRNEAPLATTIRSTVATVNATLKQLASQQPGG